MKIKIPLLALTPHGGGRVLVEIANALVAQGSQVTVITSNYRGTMPFILDDRIVVQKIGPDSANKILCLICFLMLSPFYLTRSKIIANHALTVVPSWIASVFFGSQYLYLVQDIEHRFFTQKHLWPLRAVCKWTYRRGRLIAANSYLAAQLVEYNPVLLTLRLGVAAGFLTRPVAADSEKKYDVLYFLRAQPHKRIDRFEEILASLAAKNITVLCISQDLALLELYANRAAVFAPADDAQLIDAFDRAKVFLLTSEHEGFALPPLEAMARGLPAVMYECGGPSVYTTHGENSLVVTDDDSATAVSYIESLLNDEHRYALMSRNAREAAQRFRLDNAVNDFTQYLENYFHD